MGGEGEVVEFGLGSGFFMAPAGAYCSITFQEYVKEGPRPGGIRSGGSSPRESWAPCFHRASLYPTHGNIPGGNVLSRHSQ